MKEHSCQLCSGGISSSRPLLSFQTPSSQKKTLNSGSSSEAASSTIPTRSLWRAHHHHHTRGTCRVVKPPPSERPCDFSPALFPCFIPGAGASPWSALLKYTWSFTFKFRFIWLTASVEKLITGVWKPF